jgi:hypothetical protein
LGVRAVVSAVVVVGDSTMLAEKTKLTSVLCCELNRERGRGRVDQWGELWVDELNDGTWGNAEVLEEVLEKESSSSTFEYPPWSFELWSLL